MKSTDDDAMAVSNGQSASATVVKVPLESAAKREFRLARNSLDKELAEHLVAQAREDGVNLVGPDGLLSGIGAAARDGARGRDVRAPRL